MYLLIDGRKVTEHKPGFPDTEVIELLSLGRKPVVISLYSNTIKTFTPTETLEELKTLLESPEGIHDDVYITHECTFPMEVIFEHVLNTYMDKRPR